jgi:hypothetical protein
VLKLNSAKNTGTAVLTREQNLRDWFVIAQVWIEYYIHSKIQSNQHPLFKNQVQSIKKIKSGGVLQPHPDFHKKFIAVFC